MYSTVTVQVSATARPVRGVRREMRIPIKEVSATNNGAYHNGPRPQNQANLKRSGAHPLYPNQQNTRIEEGAIKTHINKILALT